MEDIHDKINQIYIRIYFYCIISCSLQQYRMNRRRNLLTLILLLNIRTILSRRDPRKIVRYGKTFYEQSN